MLGGLAMKKRWQNKRKAEGKSFKEPGPNLVFGANCQVCIEKVCSECEGDSVVPRSLLCYIQPDPLIPTLTPTSTALPLL